MNQVQVNPLASEISAAASTKKPKLNGGAQLLCGWPMLAGIFGGLVGIVLGAAAYGLNLRIYRSGLPVPAKIALNLLTGLSAGALWLVVVGVVLSAL